MSPVSDLAATVLWPLVAVTLVLFGMTIASSGRPSVVAQRPSERRTDDDGAAGARGGRRSTDRLPGERTMVVVTGEASATTVRNAISAARVDGPADVVGDPRRPHPTWESRA